MRRAGHEFRTDLLWKYCKRFCDDPVIAAERTPGKTARYCFSGTTHGCRKRRDRCRANGVLSADFLWWVRRLSVNQRWNFLRLAEPSLVARAFPESSTVHGGT